MSISKSNEQNPYCIGESNNDRVCNYWTQDDRDYFKEPGGEMLNLSRLTAYAEYGEKVHDAEVHHEIPAIKADVPEFLDPVPFGKHRQSHSDLTIVEKDGIPRLRVDG